MHAVAVTRAERGRRATRPRDPRSPPRECPRQDRGEVRAPQPRSHVDPRVPSITVHLPEPAGPLLRMGASASEPSEVQRRLRASRPPRRALTRHGQRRMLRRADGRRDTRHVVRSVADANHGLRASGLSPRPCRTLRAILAQTHEHTTLDDEHTTLDATYAAGDDHVAFVRREHTTLDAMHAVAVTRAEHGRRATRPRDPRSRPRECPRQDRGEVRAPQPRSRAPTRHGP